MRKFVEFFFYSSIFLSLCAIALCIQTNISLGLPLNKPGFYLFVFGGVMAQYNLHYYVKKTAHSDSSHFEWSKKNRTAHLLLTCAGFVLLGVGVFSFDLHHYIILAVLGIITVLYSLPVLPFNRKRRLKDFGLLKICTLVLLWTVITVWFPINQVDHIPFTLLFIKRFIFLFALCLVFDIRDVEIDTAENIRTIPVIIGRNRTYLLNYTLLALFILLSFVEFVSNHNIGRLNAMVLSAGATIFITGYMKKKRPDIAYLACLDGMMLLQSVLIIIGSI